MSLQIELVEWNPNWDFYVLKLLFWYIYFVDFICNYDNNGLISVWLLWVVFVEPNFDRGIVAVLHEWINTWFHVFMSAHDHSFNCP